MGFFSIFSKKKKEKSKKESSAQSFSSPQNELKSTIQRYAPYKIEPSREKYRITDKDMLYFFVAYSSIFIIGALLLIFQTDFILRWNILFFASLLLPYLWLSLKSKYITRERKKEYVKKIAKESDVPKMQKLFVFFPEDDKSLISSNFDIVSQVNLDTRYALDKLHEIKRYAVRKKYDAVIDLKLNKNGSASFLLGKKIKKDT